MGIALETQYASLYERVRAQIDPLDWSLHLPYIDAIRKLKSQRRAVVLAHNYQAPEIFHTVADIAGDSLALAQRAAATEADVIVLCGVHFMAETAKILNPGKVVLIPDAQAGCSLASSISVADIRLLRERYPGAPVVTYVNTSAAVKAESDICCTSANALAIVESLPEDTVIFLPDRYLGRHVARQTRKRLVLWEGRCEVHERFSGEQIRALRKPGMVVLAHPECPPDVLDAADFVGSTAAMGDAIRGGSIDHVLLITECSMADNLAIEYPHVRFSRPCNLCPYMRRITLPKIHRALCELAPAVEVDADVALRARKALQRMLAVGRREVA
ncbi:MAG: quinolinate synthase NadA [Xanthomonadales bacterium]|nr:quinolinate synthase NadA [Xanthomonadales bacterium]MCE7932294.1 quinolinate synthase NadA [Xanthomonadales bacterium PRO6]